MTSLELEKPWARKERESQEAYLAFRTYLALPERERSPESVARKIQPNTWKTALNRIVKWHQSHNWEERALAALTATTADDIQARSDLATLTAEEWAQRANLAREKAFHLGIAILEAVADTLKASQETKEEETGEGGDSIPARSYADPLVLLRLSKAALQGYNLCREGAQIPGAPSRTELTGRDGEAIKTEGRSIHLDMSLVEALPPEQRVAITRLQIAE